ncbi:MAG: protein kinase, partial [Planctomycetota bacterium]
MPSQRDMLFLKIARKNSLLSPEQAEKILTAIERRAEIGVEKDAGAIARELEFLRDVEVESIERVLRHSLPPERVGGFKIIDRVGRGSVGTVYRARQLSLDKIVALKLMHQKLSDQARFVEQFIHEAKAVARLNHPHIVHAFDAGEAEGHFYFAMEYIDGESLGEKLRRRGKLTESEVLGLARAVTQ